MKRLIFLLTFFCFIFANAQEYTKFMGISLKLSQSAFENKLIEKGFKKIGKSVFTGTIDNANDFCNVTIYAENGKIKLVSANRFSQKNDTLSAIQIFRKRYEQLSNRYGKHCYIQESNEPYDFQLQQFTFYFYDRRIFLFAATMDNERHVSGIKKGDKVYVISETYLPLP